MNQNIFGKFSDSLKKVLILAETTAREQNMPMDTQHQLYAISSIKDSIASEILSNLNIAADRLKLSMSFLAPGISAPGLQITPDAKLAIEEAIKIAAKYDHNAIDNEHLLLALVKNKKYNSYLILSKIGQSAPREISNQIEGLFLSNKEASLPKMNIENEQSPFEMSLDDPIGFTPNSIGPLSTGSIATKEKKDSILEHFGTNITKMANENKLDPVIGREAETERITQILSRRTKNNPILVGEPGVGKTSIVEGLAYRIIHGKVPSKLIGKELYSLDIGSVIAGTMYRGQFESRIKKVLAEIKKRNNIILFIDEIHTIVGAGSTEGSVDAANLLKPMLSRGELRLIGSTTIDEYKKYIEKDPAFERRFQPVKVTEPTVEDTIDILNGIKKKYEQHHNVKYTKEALVAAAILSKRYITDRFLPDKAVDLIDEAAAAKDKVTPEIARLTVLKKELRKVLKNKEDLIIEEKYQEATLQREKEIKIENEIKKLHLVNKTKEIIDEKDIHELISKFTGIPTSNLDHNAKTRILNLEKNIKKRIIGQDEAVSEISKAIKKSRVGISNPNRPAGSFIFLGPTGVGKSELAKVVAKEVLGDERKLIKIDMSEFMERHNLSRLVGAPAGYIGYEEGGKLTEIVRKNPYSVILLDEIEKAHPEIFNILLQILEDGTLTDAKGRTIDFKNTIVIMTSNLGTDILRKQASIGFGSPKNDNEYEKLKSNVIEAVEKHFKPEFINRLDKIIVFRPLSKPSIEKIVEIQLLDLKKRLEAKKFKLKYDSCIKKWIAEKGYDPAFGARPIRRVISEHIESAITDAVLEEKYSLEDTIKISITEDKIALS